MEVVAQMDYSRQGRMRLHTSAALDVQSLRKGFAARRIRLAAKGARAGLILGSRQGGFSTKRESPQCEQRMVEGAQLG